MTGAIISTVGFILCGTALAAVILFSAINDRRR